MGPRNTERVEGARLAAKETTMRFMMIVKSDDRHEAGVAPDPRLMEAVGKLAAEMEQAGRMVFSGGLAPSSQGVRIQAKDGDLTRVDGPFAETKELIGGFAIIEYASREEAIEAGRQFMKLHQDILGPSYQGQLEIRQVVGPEDFTPQK
jgi:hypothetical protein